MMVHVRQGADKGVAAGAGAVPDADTGEATEATAETPRTAPHAADGDDGTAAAGRATGSPGAGSPGRDQVSEDGPGADGDDRDPAETTLVQDFAPIRPGGDGAAGRDGDAAGAEAGHRDTGEDDGADSDATTTMWTIDLDAVLAAARAAAGTGDTAARGFGADEPDADDFDGKTMTADEEKPTTAPGGASGADTGGGDDDPDRTTTLTKIDISALGAPAGPGAGRGGAADAAREDTRQGAGDDDDPDSTAAISRAAIQAALDAADRADRRDGKRRETTAKGTSTTDRRTTPTTGKAPADPTGDDHDTTANISTAEIAAALRAADQRDGKRPADRAGERSEVDDDGDSTAVIPKIVLPEEDDPGRQRRGEGTASRGESGPVRPGPTALGRESPATAPGRRGSAEADLDRTPTAAAAPFATPPAPPAEPVPPAEPAPATPAAAAHSPPPPAVPRPKATGLTEDVAERTAEPATQGPTLPGTVAPGTAPPATPVPGAAGPVPPAPDPAPSSRTSWWQRITGQMPQVAAPAAESPGTSAPAAESEIATAPAPAARPEPKPEPEPEPRPAPSARLGRVATWLPPLLTLEGLIMYVLSLKVAPGFLRGVDLDKINGLGLISVLPGAALASIVLLIAAFFITLTQNLDRKGVLLFQLAAITFALHGAAALVEDEPRFHTAWVHAGFAEYIGRVGEALPGLDARFSWPGFFSVFGFVTRAADISDLAPILKWTPLVSNLLYLVPFVLILRQIVATTRARWFAALLFVLVQWIGQDYFSPQGFTYLLYLIFVAVLLRWFGRVEHRAGPLPEKGRIRRLLAWLDRLTPGELPPQGDGRDRLLAMLLLIGLFTATTATHQVTPFMMLGALTGFILLRRTTFTLAMPVFLGLIVVAWLSYQATPYWSGHFDQLFGGIGRIFDNLQENTGDRLAGTDPEHAIVLKTRLGILAVILLLAAVGLLRRLRRGVLDRVAVVLLCIPVLALGLQSYGGEIGLRVYLFALPGSCILAAYAFFPNPQLSVDAPEIWPQRGPRLGFLPSIDPVVARRIAMGVAAVTAVVLSGAFLIARYGNEKFERITTDEAAAMHYIYENDKPSARVLYLVPELNLEVTPTIPWRERDIDVVEYREALAPRDPTQISHLINQLRTMGPQTYLIASRGQDSYLELAHGYPADWGKRFREALNSSRQLKAVFERPDAAVYVLRSYPRGTEVPAPPSIHLVGDRGTPWTPYGLAALAVTWIAFFGYEVLRLGGLDRARRARRRFLMVAIPAAVVAVAVVIERFVELGFG